MSYPHQLQNASSSFDVAHWAPYLIWAERHKLWLFPVQADTKKPAIKWKQGSSPFRADWETWLAQGYMLAINAFKSGLVLLDVDVGHVGRDLAWKVYSEYMASLGVAHAFRPYCQSASGGWHVMMKRPPGIKPEELRGLVKPRMTSDARPLAEGEEDAEIISLRNIGYCIAPGSTFKGRTYLLYHPDEPHPCPEKMIAEELRLPVVEHRAAGVAGESEPVDVAALVTALYAAGEFDDEEDWKLRGLAPIKLALGDTEEGRAVGRMITWDEVTEAEFNEQWYRFTTVDNGGKNLYRIGSMIRRAEELTGKKFRVRKSFKAQFGSVVEVVVSPSIVPGAGGAMPMVGAQAALSRVGAPIVAAVPIVAPPAGCIQIPREVSFHDLFEPLNKAIPGMLADPISNVDALAILHQVHEQTFLNLCNIAPNIDVAAVKLRSYALGDKAMQSIRSFDGWQKDTKNQVDSKNSDNVKVFLRRIGAELRFNGWSEEIQIRGHDWPVWTLVNDDVVAELSTTAASTEHGFRPTDNLLWKALLAIARKNTIDPALTKLKELQLKWDGVPRLDTWLHVACGTPNDEYHTAAGLNLIGGMVRRVRNPACKHDESTLFISKQGLEKSGLIEALAPDAEWYSAGVLLGEKQTELVLLLAGRALVEIAEMDSATAAGNGRKKAMLTRPIDMGRTAYSRVVARRRRRNVFAITVNADTPLTDPTGNRRFLPVRLKRAVDMEWVRANRDQLLGEACAREAAGETFRIRKALWQIAAEHQERAREKPAWEERLEDELCEEVGAGYVLSGDVQNFVDSFEKRPVPSSLWRAVMDRLKFEPYQARPEPGQKKRRLWVRGPYTDETPRLTLSRYDLPPMPSRQTADQPAAGGTEEPIAAAPDGRPPMPTQH